MTTQDFILKYAKPILTALATKIILRVLAYGAGSAFGLKVVAFATAWLTGKATTQPTAGEIGVLGDALAGLACYALAYGIDTLYHHYRPPLKPQQPIVPR